MVNWWLFWTRRRSINRINKVMGTIRGEMGYRYEELKREASEMSDLMTLYNNVRLFWIDLQGDPTKANLEELRNAHSLLKSKLSQIKKEDLKIEHLLLIINHDVQTFDGLVAGIEREKARR